MSGSGTSGMPPANSEATPPADQTRPLFDGVISSKDGVLKIDFNKLGDDAETAVEVGKVLGGKVLTAADEKISGFMASLRQHVDAAAAEVRAKQTATPTDPAPPDQPQA